MEQFENIKQPLKQAERLFVYANNTIISIYNHVLYDESETAVYVYNKNYNMALCKDVIEYIGIINKTSIELNIKIEIQNEERK